MKQRRARAEWSCTPPLVDDSSEARPVARFQRIVDETVGLVAATNRDGNPQTGTSRADARN